MSVQQYLRKVTLLVGDTGGQALDLSDLHFRFVIRRGDMQTPNSAEIRVYNVSPDTAARLKAPKEFGRVIIQAGYEGNYGLIFDGTIKQVRLGRETPTDTYADITAADGDSAYNFSFMCLSLAAGSKPSDHVSATVQAMTPHGVTQGYVPDLGGNPLPRGKVMYGMPRDFLRNTARSRSFDWSIQDGKLQVVPQSAYLPGEIPVINAATGMVGLPEQTQNGIKVKMLLNPSIKVDGRIHLDNNSIQQYELGIGLGSEVQNGMVTQQNKFASDGIYKVLIVDHFGDTRGNDWYTEVLCIAVDATTSMELFPKTGEGIIPPPNSAVKPYG